MEKKVKALYVITIACIVACLGMQGWWLYGRYVYSLAEIEKVTTAALAAAVDDYRAVRSRAMGQMDKNSRFFMTNYNVDHSRNLSQSTMDAKATVTITGYDMFEVLGIPRGKVGKKEIEAFRERLKTDLSHPGIVEEKAYALKGISNKVDLMEALADVAMDYLKPFTVAGMDSVLKSRDISASARIVSADSMIWKSRAIKNASLFAPEMQVLFPVNALDRKAVVFSCRIPPDKVLGSMLWTFILVISVSLMLIACLVWQVATIARLNRIDKTRRSFIQTMVHELKRPVSTLKMCVSSLENEKMMADETVRQEIIGESRTAISNLSAYFSRLRDITYNEAGQIPLNIEACSLRELVSEEIRKTDRPHGKSVRILDVSAEEIEVVCDPLHISQMLGNLIENAVKYSGDAVEIRIDFHRDDHCVEISVADDGNGISEADCRRIFDKFYRTRSASDSDKPGVGLGLAYVRLLAEAHGGSVSVRSREGEGSVFTITIPQ